MSFGAILLLAVGLSMDATAVSAARGFSAARVSARDVAAIALLFGGFQALMPLCGWFLGGSLGAWATDWDHWIAFALLSVIGGKMLWEARSSSDEAGPRSGGFGWRVLLVLALATSVDAFAAGITLPLLDAPFVASLVTIGVTTALLSACGIFLGRRFGAALGKRLDVAGGLVLIALGLKTLIEHLSAT